MQGSHACVMLLAFRDGRNLGTRAFFPKTNGSESAEEVLSAFVSQYYAEQPAPGEIVLDRDIEDRELLQEALSNAAGKRVQLRSSVRGERAGYLDMARRNAELALAREEGDGGVQEEAWDKAAGKEVKLRGGWRGERAGYLGMGRRNA